MNTDRELEETLRFDPLAAAESICGTDTEEYLGLGLLMAQGHARVKNQLLTERNDTTLVNTLDRYLHIVTGAGFETVLTMPFEGRSYSDRPAPLETLYVLAHPDGLLLRFDTYGSDHVNSAKVWYNWRPAPLCREQAQHLATDDIILFPVTGDTAGIGSLAEIGFALCQAMASSRYFVFLCEPGVDHDLVADPVLTKESLRARALVRAHLGQIQLPNVFVCETRQQMLAVSLALHRGLGMLRSARGI